jgi:NADP-dependent aldehyde dehydrogenase
MVGQAVQKAAQATGMPDGVFSMLQGQGHDIGTAMAKHPITRAIGFTGSLTGGRALFDAAASRPDPIPVYAEMGSINPVFILPGAAGERTEQFAAGLAQSVTMGAGQFCTNPGLVVGLDNAALNELIEKTASLISEQAPSSMLYSGLCNAYGEGVEQLESTEGVSVVGRSSQTADVAATQGAPTVFKTDAATFLSNDQLREEVFGPSSLFVAAGDKSQLEQIARRLDGQLTASIHGNDDELADHSTLVALLEDRVGRLVFNSFPTGVEVCPSMNHGGPYPATTDVHFTSVGTGAIQRFARPLCYQGFPQASLPAELRDRNERGIWRLINNETTRDDV